MVDSAMGDYNGLQMRPNCNISLSSFGEKVTA
jgi:hypothetical protein